VLIRCDKCSTVYELDEKVLPAGGAPVQCSRCQYIFTAFPPRARPPARTDAASECVPTSDGASVPPSVPGGESHASVGDAAAPPAVVAAPQPPRAAPDTGGQQFTADGRPIRKVPFPEEDPTPLGPRTFAKSVSVSSRRSRSTPLLLWVVPIAVVALAIAGIVAWRIAAGRRPKPEAVQRRAEGHSLLLRDDRASLARAVVAFEDSARLDPRLFEARADAALARALVLGLTRAEAERFVLRAEVVERAAAQAGAEHPANAELAAEASRLRAEADAVRVRTGKLAAEIRQELTPLLRDHGGDAAVVRAAAMLAAMSLDPARAAVLARARAVAARDRWVDVAEAAAASSDGPESRAEAVARAETVARAHPEALRAGVLLACALARSGRVDEAVAAAERVLAENPAHDDARALAAVLRAPPPAPAPLVSVEPVPTEAPPPGTPEPSPGKTISQTLSPASP
jgi:predicted Zn finger-like uncharacterized protein